MAAPPGPSEFGNLLLAPKVIKDPRGPIMDCTARYGSVWQSRIVDKRGVVRLVWLMGPAGNERVLSPKYRDDFSWYEGYSFSMEPLFGRDILFLLDDPKGTASDGDSAEDAAVPGTTSAGMHTHRERLRLLIPAFHPRLDGEYLPDMAGIIGSHLARLPTGQPIDLAWEIKRVTFHIVAQLLFGAPEQDLLHLTHLFEQVGLGLFSLVRLRIPGTNFYRAVRARAELSRYLLEKIAAYRRGEQLPPTMLAQLMKQQTAAGDLLPDETLVAEMIAFLFAGYDTTSSMLTSLFVALGDHPEVYARLCREVREGQEADRVAGAGDTQEQPYLDAVLLETERLFPPLLFAIRGAVRDFEFGGFQVSKGDKVAYSAYYTGRLAELWEEPLQYRPERFLGSRRVAPYTLLGFGGGHRICIGKRFAALEMRLFTSMLLQRFELTFVPQKSDAVFFNPTLQRKHGYTVMLSARTTPTGT